MHLFLRSALSWTVRLWPFLFFNRCILYIINNYTAHKIMNYFWQCEVLYSHVEGIQWLSLCHLFGKSSLSWIIRKLMSKMIHGIYTPSDGGVSSWKADPPLHICCLPVLWEYVTQPVSTEGCYVTYTHMGSNMNMMNLWYYFVYGTDCIWMMLYV